MNRALLLFLIPVLLIYGGIAQFEEGYNPLSLRIAESRSEVQEFLAQDTVSNNTRVPYIYNCVDRAVDLWYNSYKAGFDTFIIVKDKEGSGYHLAVGFEAGNVSKNVLQSYLQRTYWGEGDMKWFYVEPKTDYTASRNTNNPTDYMDKEGGVEIITYIKGEDAFNLWRAMRDGGSIIPALKLCWTIWSYKLKKGEQVPLSAITSLVL